MNILLKKFATPFETVPFNEIKPSDFMPALKEAIVIAKKRISDIKSNTAPETFSNVVEALENASPEVEIVSGVFFNLHSAETNDEIQAIAKDFSPLLTEYGNDISLDSELFKKIKKVWDTKESFKLNAEQLMLLEKSYKSFVRNGALLNENDKNVMREISTKLSTLGLKFGDHILKETNDFLMLVENVDDLKGLPADVIEAASTTAKEKGHEGKWAFTLQYPSVIPFLTHASNRELRKKLWMANSTKGFKDGETDNKEIIKEIASLRHQKANLLGYESHAHFILEERMASNPQTVFTFMENIVNHATPAAVKETEELKAYAKKLDGDEAFELQKWDTAYYAEKLKNEKFQVNDEMLRPYFKLENVIAGVFQVATKLYGLTFLERKDIPVYHEDVKTYEVLDEKGNHVSVFYADFHPRAGKRNGAWMTSFRGQKIEGNTNVRPHVAIVCNFTKPTSSKPSLLGFDEVTTLFHEFGHALHGMLANTQYESLSGTNVYWDFVELPSQIMENWAYEKECLDLFAEHFETKEKIPADLIKKIKDSSSFLEGRATLRQLSFATIDMAWHSKNPSEVKNIEEFESKMTSKMDFLPSVKGTSISTAFSHVFAGGYSAGYYSYKWAEVLDADAFEFFKEKGIFNREVATKFKDHVLSQGGSKHPMDLYVGFRGQKPNPDALLRRAGLLSK
ncbi:MAG: M3 family metallopeptidase [Bacteriovoracaceae bacterium]|nr:M3 family metallopeptidase [Bacteriovoracaceae bacterium]